MTKSLPVARFGVVSVSALPYGALLQRYQDKGAYTDCYRIEIAAPVCFADYVAAFYTTPLFKLERLILASLIARPSTDHEARDLAEGKLATFAAWDVECRESNQILLCDYQGRTRSWLMTAASGDGATTGLYFGSAVVPSAGRGSGRRKMGSGFSFLRGFHKLYSRMLLRAAYRRLRHLGHKSGRR